MKERFWLASYPSSGNTWLRALIGCLSLPGVPDINGLAYGSVLSTRKLFDEITLIDSALLSHDEVDDLRPLIFAEPVWTAAASKLGSRDGALPIEFVKVHDAYTLTSSGEPVLGGKRGARAAVLVVRDPRDVAPSLANHNRSTIDEAIDYMSDAGAALFGDASRPHHQVRQKLAGWSGHVESWLEQRDIPVHVVRYEDMHHNTACVLHAAMRFAGCEITHSAAERAASLARFEHLEAQEITAGFCEWHDINGRRFFRHGKTGGWRHELTARQVDRIEGSHAAMMARLGYALSTCGASRRPGDLPSMPMARPGAAARKSRRWS